MYQSEIELCIKIHRQMGVKECACGTFFLHKHETETLCPHCMRKAVQKEKRSQKNRNKPLQYPAYHYSFMHR